VVKMPIRPLEEIALQDGTTIEPDKFISYGFDKKYFAIIGKDLYHKAGDGTPEYRLLRKDFMEDKSNKKWVEAPK